MSNLPGIAGSLEVTSSDGLPCVISASMYSGSSDGPRLRLPSSESASEPDADAEGDRLSAAGGGDFLRDDEAAAVVDFRFGFGFVADVVLVLSFALDLGAEVEGPSPGDARGRGGLKGSRRRFWAGWRSAGMLLAGFWCKKSPFCLLLKTVWICCVGSWVGNGLLSRNDRSAIRYLSILGLAT